MRFHKLWLFVLGGIGLVSALFGFENATKPWREYPAFEYNDFPVPPDYQQKTEWAFARLMYPNTTNPNVWGIGPGVSGATAATGGRAAGAFSGPWIIRGRTGISPSPSGV